MTTELDVRTEDAAAIVTRLEDTLDRMSPGDTVRLISSADPRPTRDELAERRVDEFEWAAVDDGPDVWTADITSRTHVVDARPTLAAGGEPFDEIMRAAGQVGHGEVLVVLAPFDPVPLQGVLGAQGFSYDSSPIGDGDFRAVFRLG